jgi:signal transduction histidine kinase
MRYQYKLEGIDANWSGLSALTEVPYGNLPPGNYTFKVRAMNGDGYWSKTLTYPFSIRPPWWKTWWAYVLYVGLFAAAVYIFIQYRTAQAIRKVKVLEAIRTKISSDLHDDVGSILSGLAMQSQVMAYTAPSEIKTTLNELSDMSRDAMERMRDVVWVIDSRKDKYENLIDRMRIFAEKNLGLKNIAYHFELNNIDGKKFIDPEKRQNIYLIFKEVITNILKHSDATQVRIVFAQEKSQLRLLIHDNGTLKEQTPSDGLGLSNMTMRAEKIGGSLSAEYEDGFRVELVLG